MLTESVRDVHLIRCVVAFHTRALLQCFMFLFLVFCSQLVKCCFGMQVYMLVGMEIQSSVDSFNESIIGGYFVRLTGRSTLSVLCDFDINPKWSLSSRIYSSQFSEKVKTVWINYDTSLYLPGIIRIKNRASWFTLIILFSSLKVTRLLNHETFNTQ